jgi:hypothetical protein
MTGNITGTAWVAIFLVSGVEKVMKIDFGGNF